MVAVVGMGARGGCIELALTVVAINRVMAIVCVRVYMCVCVCVM